MRHIQSVWAGSLLSLFLGLACQTTENTDTETATEPGLETPASTPQPMDAPDPLATRDDIANYSRVNERVVAAGQPEPSAWQAIHEAGITTVINLRTEEEGALEEAPIVEEAGMRYVHVPVDSSGFDESKLAIIEQALADAEGQTMIHCASSNRVGAFWYLHQVMKEGVEPNQAMEAASAAGLSSETLREHVLDYAASQSSSSEPEH